MPANTGPAPIGSAASARRAAGTRHCWRRCAPTTRAMPRCGWPTPRRSTPNSPLSSPAGVLDPLLRYELAQKAGNAELLDNHHNFWGDAATMAEGNPPRMLDRGEKVHLPPALVFGGDKDEWVPVELMRHFADSWHKAGGEVELQL